jgi:hypothetical protein
LIPDVRGWRIALVPEVLMHPPDALKDRLPDVMSVLDHCGYGLLQLPPAGEHGLLLAVICDQVFEYRHHGYAIVALGLAGEPDRGLHWRRVAQLLRHRGVPLPPRHIIQPGAEVAAETGKLTEMLNGYDLPPAEQRHWRV